jgi:hypothetical protein
MNKVSVGPVSFELEQLQPAEMDWRVQAGSLEADARRLTSAVVFDSYASTLYQQLAEGPSAEVARIDLGNGDQWLTSRLHLFSILLERNRGVRCLAFTHAQPGQPYSVLGTASPRQVRFALASTSPWLEAAWAAANDMYFGPPANNPKIDSSGALSADGARLIARQYLERIQCAEPPPPGQGAEWLHFPAAGPFPASYEHTSWLRPDDLPRSLNRVIDRDSSVIDDPTTPSESRWDAVMVQRGPFVTLVARSGGLNAVVDRLATAEAAVRRQLASRPSTVSS